MSEITNETDKTRLPSPGFCRIGIVRAINDLKNLNIMMSDIKRNKDANLRLLALLKTSTKFSGKSIGKLECEIRDQNKAQAVLRQHMDKIYDDHKIFVDILVHDADTEAKISVAESKAYSQYKDSKKYISHAVGTFKKLKKFLGLAALSASNSHSK